MQAAALRLDPAMKVAFQRAENRLKTCAAGLNHLSPYGVLERGYSITMDDSGHVVRGVKGLAEGTRLTTRLADGSATSVVERISMEGAA